MIRYLNFLDIGYFMEDFDDFEFQRESANSELRYLTLELMKIAVRRRKSFDVVAKEFIRNTYYLKNLIMKVEENVRKGVKNERKSKKSNKPY